ncbi:DUF1761 domain-containing protein [Allosphingosinicella flava]|uniref:DUF1761 domain-containing protein n=1 Tax=Allosphingosinicella flava TaxID=2771430 RepID=A0A7T2LL71_9SPHN|nr:DUF1761 domain-containing protein [Sphingosinicella flava]QPQ54068.1 DUF1761 domain-containing protein [Sphingosinicella flava]
MNWTDLNWPAVIVAGVLGFFVGGLWYSNAMFLKAWQADSGIEGHQGSMPPAMRFGLGILLSLVAAAVFAALVGPAPALTHAIGWALAVGAGFIVTSFGIQHLFEGKSARLTLINGGYHVAQFLIFALVLGLWH